MKILNRIERMVRQAGRVGLLVAVVMGSGCASSRLIEPGSRVEKLAGGFRFTEGPAVRPDGSVAFSDIPNNRIHLWSVESGNVSILREESGGANGLYYDAAGHLYACEGKARRLTVRAPDGEIRVLADGYQGRRLNSPNDLWMDPEGGIYFTDPRYGRDMSDLEQDGFHVYYLSPDRRYLRRVADDLAKPNGIVGTADGRTLYIADPGASSILFYSIRPDGRLANKRVLTTMGSDGMTLDERGNVYITSGAVHIFSPSGANIGVIDVPEKPANVCFGGEDGRTLFITARTSLYAIRMNVAGQAR